LKNILVAVFILIAICSCKRNIIYLDEIAVNLDTKSSCSIKYFSKVTSSRFISENYIQEEFNVPEFVITEKIPDTIKLLDLNIEGDFDGDGSNDFASTVLNTQNSKEGVIIIHNTRDQPHYIFGAGISINGMTDLGWIDIFEIIPRGNIITPTEVNPKTGDILGPDKARSYKLKSDGILMHVDESSGGGILFWNRYKYQWYHIE